MSFDSSCALNCPGPVQDLESLSNTLPVLDRLSWVKDSGMNGTLLSPECGISGCSQ